MPTVACWRCLTKQRSTIETGAMSGTDAFESSQPAILVEGLRKSFGALAALDGVDVSVPRGSVLGLLGPNGAGKTTLVRILATTLLPDAGRARVLGLDVVGQAGALRPSIGLAGQSAAVDETLTARENLRLIGQLCHRRISAIDAQVDVLIERFGLTGNDKRPARTLSGGMRRRLDLAAALVHRPTVVFLDEPTTGLDPNGRVELWEMIRELVAEGATILLTTQYLEEADQLSDKIVVIDHGRIIARGTPDDLKKTLGTTILEVRLSDTASARAATGLLTRLGITGSVESNETVAVRLSDKGPQILDVVRALDANQLTPVSLDVREPTLDDVFRELTSDGSRSGRTAEAHDSNELVRASRGLRRNSKWQA
jgi:ABC-2 type transport system ATP-binding protein